MRIMRVFMFIRGIMPIILCGWIHARVHLARECSLLYVCVCVCVCMDGIAGACPVVSVYLRVLIRHIVLVCVCVCQCMYVWNSCWCAQECVFMCVCVRVCLTAPMYVCTNVLMCGRQQACTFVHSYTDFSRQMHNRA